MRGIVSNDEEEPAAASSSSSDKYYKKFDFFYKRTCFRLMAEFYKLTFQPYQKQWIDQRRRSDLKELIVQYAQVNFSHVLNELKGATQEHFMAMLAMVVLSHRHNKEDTISRKDDRKDLDFTIVRDTMYKYSKKAQDRFFRIPSLAYLFISFASSNEGRQFISQKFSDKGADYLLRMGQEMDELRGEAVETMKKCRNEKASKELISLLFPQVTPAKKHF